MFYWLRIIFPFWVLFFSVSIQAEESAVLHLSPLHLALPLSWKIDVSKSPIVGTGPNGEKLLISVMKKDPSSGSSSALTSQEVAANIAENRMSSLASKDGQKVIRPVSPVPTPEGKVGFSTASESSGLFSGDRYFVQYLLASDLTIIYFTFEGKGKALPATEIFDEILASQKWDN